MCFYIGAGGETRTHVGFPTAYKTVAIAAMRLQLNLPYRITLPIIPCGLFLSETTRSATPRLNAFLYGSSLLRYERIVSVWWNKPRS